MITVLMPTYNCAAYISDAIKSILNQTFKEYEFLIIDDGSTDNTEEIVSHFKDSRICYIKKRHTGLPDSLNFGLKKATYDLIARMDADDISHPLRLEQQLNYLKMNNEIDILSCWSAFFSGKSIIYILKNPIDNEKIKKGLLLYSYILHPGCIYSKKIILENGGYKGNVFEDYILWLKLMNNVKFSNIPEVLIFQRFRKNSLSRENLNFKNRLIYDIQEPYYKDLGNSFSIENRFEMNTIKGWREYFYGTPRLARKLWRSSAKNLVKDYRISIAYLISLLPIKVFLQFKEARVKFRIQYFLNYCKKENEVLRKELNILLKR